MRYRIKTFLIGLATFFLGLTFAGITKAVLFAYMPSLFYKNIYSIDIVRDVLIWLSYLITAYVISKFSARRDKVRNIIIFFSFLILLEVILHVLIEYNLVSKHIFQSDTPVWYDIFNFILQIFFIFMGIGLEFFKAKHKSRYFKDISAP